MKRFCALLILAAIPFVNCMKEEFGGIGVEVPTGEGKVTEDNPYIIESVFKGGSGETAGLREHDVIVSIDGRTLSGLNHSYIVQNLLRGKIGTSVILEIDRNVDGKMTRIVYKIPRIKIVLQE